MVRLVQFFKTTNPINELVDAHSPEFRKWFGDSKVVDNAGKPLVLHHGTNAQHDFGKLRAFSHFGSLDAASEFAQIHFMGGGARIYPVYLRIANPIIMKDSGRGHTTARILDDLLSAGQELGVTQELKHIQRRWEEVEVPEGRKTIQLIRSLKNMGFDGIVYYNATEGTYGPRGKKAGGSNSWIPFHQNQIKYVYSEATNDNTLGGGAGILVFVPSTGHILVQIRGEHPDDDDSGKYDFFGGTLEEGETSEECARREAKEEGGLEFPKDGIEEIGAFSSTEGGDWDGEPYHVFIRVEEKEFPVRVDKKEVAKAAWVGPSAISPENSTSRLIKAIEHLSTDQINEAIVSEAVFDTDEDVDWIFDTYYRDIFEQIQNGTWDGQDLKTSFLSSELPSENAKKASAMNPVRIFIAIYGIGNYYKPTDQQILITPNSSAMRLLKANYGSIESSVNAVDKHQKEHLRREYDGTKLRSSIAHELSHWMDDTFHSGHIKKRLLKHAGEISKGREVWQKSLAGKYKDDYAAPTEINAQIHQIRQLRRTLQGIWNNLTFEDMVRFDGALDNTSKNMQKLGIYDKWKRSLLSRMAREKLLGSNMSGINESVRKNRSNLPDEVANAFVALGDAQRGDPERIMVKLQHLMGGGILNPVIEHVGDLTHRMSHMATWGEEYEMGREYVLDKAQKTHSWLTNQYGFEREMLENIKSNAAHRGIDPEELKRKIFGGLEVYARAHAKIPVYNKIQWIARQAAIDVGKRNWDDAAHWLQFLYVNVKDRDNWLKRSMEYELAPDGVSPIQYPYK